MLRPSVVASLLALIAAAPPAPPAQKVRPEDVVQGHVERTLGSSDRRVRDRSVRGSCRMTTTTMGAGWLEGPFTMTSSPDASNFSVQFKNEAYEGESFSFDGENVEIAFAQPRRGLRSAMGLFLSVNRVVIREGLFGGVLNARWPLFDAARREAKISYDGRKKLDGRERHRLRYRARRDQGDLSILLYFDPDTFRHVATVYESSRAQGMGLTMEQSSQLTEQRFHLEESFSGFDARDGVTLPGRWVVRYARTGDSTTEWKYDCKVQ